MCRNRKISLCNEFYFDHYSRLAVRWPRLQPRPRRADCHQHADGNHLFRFISKSQSPPRSSPILGISPDYTITAQIPTIKNSTIHALWHLLRRCRILCKSLIADFKKNMASMGPAADSRRPAIFDVRYQLVSPPGNILSIKYQTEGYVAGMAHPYHLIYTFNYDLEAGKDIALSDLFLANTDYLGAHLKVLFHPAQHTQYRLSRIFRKALTRLPIIIKIGTSRRMA